MEEELFWTTPKVLDSARGTASDHPAAQNKAAQLTGTIRATTPKWSKHDTEIIDM